MAALRRRKVLKTLLKLTRRSRRSESPAIGPGCTCESCVQAWDRHQSPRAIVASQARGMRLGFD
jgi:hypothetical protein